MGSRDYKVLSILLQAHKSEKDFLKSHQEEYINEFQVTYKRLQTHVKTSDFPNAYKSAVLNTLKVYNSAFLVVVAEQQIMGLTAETGLQKNMHDSALDLKKNLDILMSKTTAEVQQYMSSIEKLTYLLFAVALLIAIVVGWLIPKEFNL